MTRPPADPAEGRARRGGLAALAFAPSLILGALGAAWYFAAPPDRAAVWSWPATVAAGLAVGGAALAAGAALERRCPSFRRVSRRTERALRALRLSPATGLALAAATSLGEELLFRGVLLDRIGWVGQALLFGALHPAGRRGWAYPAFAVVIGLALGALVLASGRIEGAIAAHLLINATAFWTTRRSSARRDGAPPPA